MNINFAEISDIKARRKAFLLDTANFYNALNRAVYTDGICSYSPVGDYSPGCAIGRHLERDNIIIQNKYEGGIGHLCAHYGERILPQWMREMDVLFLSGVQFLHDTHTFWHMYGLNELGKEQLEKLMKAWELE